MAKKDSTVPQNANPIPEVTACAVAMDTVIEQLANGQLLFAPAKGEEKIDTSIKHGGVIYRPAVLDAALEAALHLPNSVAAVDDKIGVAERVRREFTSSGATGEQAALLTAFVLATWVGDYLPAAPILNLFGAGSRDAAVLDLIAALVRRPLQLAHPTLAELMKLPQGLAPTLVLRDPDRACLEAILAAAGRAGVGVLRNGRYHSVRCSLVIVSEEELGIPSAISLHLLASTTRAKRSRVDLADSARQYGPDLLRYRISHHCTVLMATVDVAGFAPGTELCAHVFGSATAPVPALQSEVLRSLQSQVEDARFLHSMSPRGQVLAALLALLHRGDAATTVGKIADLVNVLRHKQGEAKALSPKAIGTLLRRQLGFHPCRTAAGFELALDRVTSESIRAQAKALGVHPSADLNVQEVQNVHDGQRGGDSGGERKPPKDDAPAGREICAVEESA